MKNVASATLFRRTSGFNLYAMKILYLPLLALLCSCCSSKKQEKTGIVYAGNFELLDKTALSEKWNAILLRKGIAARLSQFKIRKSRDLFSDSVYFYLIAETNDQSVKAASLLYRKKNYFYLEKNPEFVVCPCLEASPKRAEGKWICETQTGADCPETILAEK